jgi:glyoxalase family protein
MPALHHVTAIGKDMRFYTEVLGLSLVKKTVNFDDPFTYHLYFGDDVGSPGTALTFFLWDMPPVSRGTGQITTVMYRASDLPAWEYKLKRYSPKISKRFGDDILGFTDPNGLSIELVDTGEKRLGRFYGAVIDVTAYDKYILDALGFTGMENEGNIYRFRGKDILDVIVTPDRLPGSLGNGAIHHIAFRAKDDKEQMSMRQKLTGLGLSVTPQIDRSYFKSIYFRLPSGVLFEIATDGPGFLVDEKKNSLGKKLMLPKQYEPIRDKIEEHLEPL